MTARITALYLQYCILITTSLNSMSWKIISKSFFNGLTAVSCCTQCTAKSDSGPTVNNKKKQNDESASFKEQKRSRHFLRSRRMVPTQKVRGQFE